MVQRSVAVVVLALISCKSAPPPAPEPARVAPVLEPAPAQPVEPLVELSAARPLPDAPKGLARVVAPDDNPLTAEKADLGWRLFFDKRLSKDGSMACVNCHHLDKAFTSGQALDAKVGGAMNKRNSPTVLNLGFHSLYYWDGRAPTLEAVSNAAWKGQLGADPAVVARTLDQVPQYRALFIRAFREPPSPSNVPKAFASFFRALNSGNSPWDRFSAGDKTALTKQQQQGQKVFFASNCATCHTPPMFSDFDFHATLSTGADEGRKDATRDEADLGKLKTPSLRNVALTGPYFHDGSAATLEAAITRMAAGVLKGETADREFVAVKLSAKDVSDVKAFLESLTGEATFTTEPTLP